MKKNVLYIIGVFAVVLLTACEHKELCYKHPHTKKVRVLFDWKNAPEAHPEGMCVFFYPQDDLARTTPQRFDFIGTTGGEIELQVGKYQIICYNNDTEFTLFSSIDNYSTHKALTREGGIFESVYGNTSTKGMKIGEERILICPDMLWGCSVIEQEISELSTQTLTLYPRALVCTYTYEIKNVKGLKNVTQLSASLSGLAPSMLLSTGELGVEGVTLPFEAHSDGDSTIYGKFYTFGSHPQSDNQNRLNLYVWMKNDGKYYYGNSEKFNVTEQIQTATDRYNVHIVIDGLDLPLPMADENGFEPSVDDWQEVKVDINI